MAASGAVVAIWVDKVMNWVDVSFLLCYNGTDRSARKLNKKQLVPQEDCGE